ncbi:hypothetical protein Syun_029818 [Stephania yunnanensis]|uniref:Uncharacterized protein n=1 Tax=Stephania yunnanensis TaxID=152371 RepID=A0AAP0E6A3_9MAGN
MDHPKQFHHWNGQSHELNSAYEALTSKRLCGPKRRDIHEATYDLAKNDEHGNELFESLPDHVFEDIAN